METDKEGKEDELKKFNGEVYLKTLGTFGDKEFTVEFKDGIE